MQHALQKLGYKSYHMTEAGVNKAFNYWYEALKAKYEAQGRPYRRAEFDKLLGNYSVRFGQTTVQSRSAKVVRLSLICPAYCLSTNC